MTQPTSHADRQAIRKVDGILPFQPHRLVRGGWMQTVSIKFLRPELSLETRPDADLISIPDDHTPPDELSGIYFPTQSAAEPKPLVVLLHGMGGNALSGYMRSAAEAFNREGYDALLWNHRGAGRSGRSCRHLHHPGYTDDIHRLTDYLHEEQSAWVEQGMVCVAFSLGANVLLKYLAETRDKSAFSAGISVSAPIDMNLTSNNLRTGQNRVFDRYLLARQKEELLRENAELTDTERKVVAACESVWDLDDRFTAVRFEYAGAEDFYADNSAINSMDRIAVPTLCLHADDDPVVDADVFAGVNWTGNKSLYPALSESGGHSGFFDSTGKRWHEQAAVAFLKRFDNAGDSSVD